MSKLRKNIETELSRQEGIIEVDKLRLSDHRKYLKDAEDRKEHRFTITKLQYNIISIELYLTASEAVADVLRGLIDGTY